MKVYGLIVGGGILSSDYYDTNPCTKIHIRYHPDSKSDVMPYKGYGLLNSGNLFSDIAYQYAYHYNGGKVYKFSYDVLLSFLRKHLDSDLLEDPTINQMDIDLFGEEYGDAYINTDRYRFFLDNDPTTNEPYINRYITSIAKESHRLCIQYQSLHIEDSTILTIKGNGTPRIPIWTLCVDLDVTETEYDGYNSDGKFIHQSVRMNEILDESPVSIMLQLIIDKLDEEEMLDDKSLENELGRLTSIANAYDMEDL